MRKWRIANPIANVLIQIRQAAKVLGVPYSISAYDIKTVETCPCCGQHLLPMGVPRDGKNGPAPNSPCITRIRPEAGYVPGNVGILCWTCTKIRGEASLDRLEAVTQWLRQMAA